MALIERGRIAWIGPARTARDDPPDCVARFLGIDEDEEGPWKPPAPSR
jgi:hypothetical protein